MFALTSPYDLFGYAVAVQRPSSRHYRPLHLAAVAGAAAAGLSAVVSIDSVAAAAGLLIAMSALVVSNLRLQHELRAAIAHDPVAPVLVSEAPGPAYLDRRFALEHPVSGLSLREALLARMNADQVGLLGALAFADFDRLTAFDPALGERVFSASIGRLRQMLPRDRFVAQVDRGHIGLWFGDGSEAAVCAELDAIGYALGEVIEIEGQRVVPQVKRRVVRFDAAAGLEAGAFLARTLASFALPVDEIVTLDRPSSDYAELARERYALEQDLRQAIERRELSLVYQPLVDAAHGSVAGAEALIRWDHAERGLIPPARFIPIMESMGLASEIGLWVLNAAVREAQNWRSHGLKSLRVAVNVSSLQLERDDLPVLVQRTLQHHDLPATALEIELTESLATSDAQHCRRIFQELRAMGVKLAVDDFGTGYSGFSSLRALAFDKIKIDREFVTGVDRRPDSQAICQSIAALGRGLGIRVLAEGVERREEYEWLRRHGCRHFQGYYFGQPMTGAAFMAFARDSDLLAALLRLDAGPQRIEERLKA